MICEYCNQKFEGKPTRRFCSQSCHCKSLNSKHPINAETTCSVCGESHQIKYYLCTHCYAKSWYGNPTPKPSSLCPSSEVESVPVVPAQTPAPPSVDDEPQPVPDPFQPVEIGRRKVFGRWLFD